MGCCTSSENNEPTSKNNNNNNNGNHHSLTPQHQQQNRRTKSQTALDDSTDLNNSDDPPKYLQYQQRQQDEEDNRRPRKTNSMEVFKKSAETDLIMTVHGPTEDETDDYESNTTESTASGGQQSNKTRHHRDAEKHNRKIVSLASLENLHSAELNMKLQALSRGRIAVFDSGVGGLSVVRQLAHQLPYEAIVYFGDQERCPYGERHPAQIRKFSKQIVEFLASQEDIKAVVIACNTASVHSLAALTQQLDIPVIGMINPGSLAVSCLAKPEEKVGVIATNSTIQSKAYELGIAKLRWDLDIFTHPTPQLAPLIENTEEYGPEEIAVIEESIAPIKEANCKVVVSGCTHYAFVADHLQKILGPETRIIDPAIAVVMKLKQVLSNSGLLRATPASEQFGNDRYLFYTSGEADKFQSVFKKWMKDIRGYDQMTVMVHNWEDGTSGNVEQQPQKEGGTSIEECTN